MNVVASLTGPASEALREATKVYLLACQVLVVRDDAEIMQVIEKWRTDDGGSMERKALSDLSAAGKIFGQLKEITAQARNRLIAAGAMPLQ